jgi:hypothetical protein
MRALAMNVGNAISAASVSTNCSATKLTPTHSSQIPETKKSRFLLRRTHNSLFTRLLVFPYRTFSEITDVRKKIM